MNRAVLIDLKGKKKFGLGVVIMKLMVLKYLVKRSGMVMDDNISKR
jgi:hypothetical protein